MANRKKVDPTELERAMIGKSMKILEKKKISRTDEKIIDHTIRLIEIIHGCSYRTQVEQ